MAMCTLKETSTTKSSRQSSSSHQQLSVHTSYSYDNVLKTSCSQLLTAFTCALAQLPRILKLVSCCHITFFRFVYYNSYQYTTCLPCQYCSESALKCNLRASIFKVFQGACPQTPLALHAQYAVHNNNNDLEITIS